MIDLSGNLLPVILTYGSPLLGLLLLLGAMGVPVPTTLLVLASGAFVRQGILELDAAVIGLCCVVAGDSLSFVMGQLGHGQLERHSNRGWRRAMHAFRSESVQRSS
jgi:membrane protein DedA with SNARE-associated domain